MTATAVIKIIYSIQAPLDADTAEVWTGFRWKISVKICGQEWSNPCNPHGLRYSTKISSTLVLERLAKRTMLFAMIMRVISWRSIESVIAVVAARKGF